MPVHFADCKTIAATGHKIITYDLVFSSANVLPNWQSNTASILCPSSLRYQRDLQTWKTQPADVGLAIPWWNLPQITAFYAIAYIWCCQGKIFQSRTVAFGRQNYHITPPLYKTAYQPSKAVFKTSAKKSPSWFSITVICYYWRLKSHYI